MKKEILFAVFFITILSFLSNAFAFSFSEYEKEEAEKEQKRETEIQQEVDRLLSTHCKKSLKRKKIAVILGQEKVYADYNLLYMVINEKLQSIGLRIYSQKEITAHIAQAELDAFLANDMDAAASAASRLKADFILRGVISSRKRLNPVLKIEEVYVSMGFSLINSNGKIISNVSATGEAFSGRDTLSAALELVKDNSDLVVAKLYSDYCKSAYK